jgi:putative membrane protein
MDLRINLAGVAGMALCMALGLGAQTKMDSGSSKMMKSADTRFASNAAQGGMAEVQLGQLAVQKATNPDVKAFGQHMVDDHTKANDELKEVAGKESITLPTNLNAKDQALMSRLQNLSGAQFDKAYIRAMVKDHEEDVKEFQKEANAGTDAGLKDFAAKTLPTLQSHLEMAKSTDAKVK